MSCCIVTVEGCEQCAAEDAYKAEQGHVCGRTSRNWRTMCEVNRDLVRRDEHIHRRMHEPARCDTCNAIVRDSLGGDWLIQQLCPSGNCTQWLCGECRSQWASAGPVGCPTCGSWPGYLHHMPRGNKKIHAMRSTYRRKRGSW